MAEKIGDFLVRTGLMSKAQLDEVLKAQKGGDKRMFGDLAIWLGYINPDAIKRYTDYLKEADK